MLSRFIFLALIQLCAAEPGRLLILDNGVGHRSTPVTRWRTSLRSVTTSGTNASILQQYGPESESGAPVVPINAFSLAYDPSTSHAFSATGQGIIRAEVPGEAHEVVIKDADGGALTISKKERKVYFSTRYDGLIKKADLDGSNVQLVRNVSQGVDYNIVSSYTPANSFADGLLVDEEKGWLYWSASRGDDSGSIRRAPLNSSGDEEVLVTGLNIPGQLRLVRDTSTQTNSLWWTEKGRWNTSPTALKLIDLSRLPEYPSSKPASAPVVPVQTMIHSDNSTIFFETDFTGAKEVLSIQSFVVFRDQVSQKVWFVMQSSGRQMFGKLVEMTWQGSGGGRKAVLKVLNQETQDIGVPIGLEYAA